MHCSVAQCLEVVGEWWSMLIVRDVFMGVTRFDAFQERLGISRNILNQRLTHLVEMGVLKKVLYSEHPPRYEYRLTDKGRDLWPVLTAMRQWGDKYAAPDGPPLRGNPQELRTDRRRRHGLFRLWRADQGEGRSCGTRTRDGRGSDRSIKSTTTGGTQTQCPGPSDRPAGRSSGVPQLLDGITAELSEDPPS